MTITIAKFLLAIIDTLYMASISLFFGILVGFPLGILLVIINKDGFLKKPFLSMFLNNIINITRSLPFIILLVTVMPFTKIVVGTTIGKNAAVIPLIIYISPYIARLIENSLLNVNKGILEAGESIGATPFQIIRYFLIPEAMPSLILSVTTAAIGLIGATAMAGTVGAGGIGNLAITYGYEQFDTIVMLSTVIVLVLFVQIIQSIGNLISNNIRNHEYKKK